MDKNTENNGKKLIPMSKEAIDKCFQNKCKQWQYLWDLYDILFPYQRYFKKIKEVPIVNEKTYGYICDRAIEFDKIHHKKVVKGGLWLFKGFDVTQKKSFPDWVADISKCLIEYKTPEQCYRIFINQWYREKAGNGLIGFLFGFPIWAKGFEPPCYNEFVQNDYPIIIGEVEE